MESIYFMVRFTPFWAIPCLLIGFEFAYLFWVRKKKKRMLGFLAIGLISAAMCVFYWVAGGPEKSVHLIRDIVWFYTR